MSIEGLDTGENLPAAGKCVSVAPMMDWTDRHCRYFHRLLSPHARLYTEMVHAQAVVHNQEQLLRFDPAEKPVALQLGGADPAMLAQAAQIGYEFGYDEINLNCGCPSDRVQEGRFGACLMAEPERVASCVAAIMEAVPIPVTVKCRIGLGRIESFAFLDRFMGTVKKAGCRTFILHARTAILEGLSPKENREIPPLRYDLAAQVKTTDPDLAVILNGGIRTVQEVRKHLETFDGVMIGREAYHNPWLLAEIEAGILGTKPWSRETVARAMIPYLETQAHNHGTPAHAGLRHMLGLYAGQPGARRWRQSLGGTRSASAEPAEIIERALAAVEQTAAQTRMAA